MSGQLMSTFLGCFPFCFWVKLIDISVEILFQDPKPAKGSPCKSAYNCTVDHMLCLDKTGDFTCLCEDGYKLSEDKTKCIGMAKNSALSLIFSIIVRYFLKTAMSASKAAIAIHPIRPATPTRNA